MHEGNGLGSLKHIHDLPELLKDIVSLRGRQEGPELPVETDLQFPRMVFQENLNHPHEPLISLVFQESLLEGIDQTETVGGQVTESFLGEVQEFIVFKVVVKTVDCEISRKFVGFNVILITLSDRQNALQREEVVYLVTDQLGFFYLQHILLHPQLQRGYLLHFLCVLKDVFLHLGIFGRSDDHEVQLRGL